MGDGVKFWDNEPIKELKAEAFFGIEHGGQAGLVVSDNKGGRLCGLGISAGQRPDLTFRDAKGVARTRLTLVGAEDQPTLYFRNPADGDVMCVGIGQDSSTGLEIMNEKRSTQVSLQLSKDAVPSLQMTNTQGAVVSSLPAK